MKIWIQSNGAALFRFDTMLGYYIVEFYSFPTCNKKRKIKKLDVIHLSFDLSPFFPNSFTSIYSTTDIKYWHESE